MARITDPNLNFESGYERAAQSRQFLAVSAIDRTKQEQLKAAQANEQERVKSNALKRQQALDDGMLKGKQTYEKAELAFNNSKDNAKLSLVKGLASLSSSAAGALGEWATNAKEKADYEAELDEAGGWLNSGGSVVVPDENTGGVTSTTGGEDLTEAVSAEHRDEELQADAVNTAAVDVSRDPELQEQIRKPTANLQATNNIQSGNVHVAATNVPAYVGDMMDTGVLVKLPDGRIIPANAAQTRQELTAVAMALVKQFAVENGISVSGASREAAIKTFIPAAKNAVVSEVNRRTAAARQASFDERKQAARTSAFSNLDAGGSVADSWNTLSNAYYSSGAFGGNRTAANDAAIKDLAENLAARGDIAGLEALADTPKYIDSNGKPGPKIGTTYSTLIETAKRKAQRIKAGDRSYAEGEAKADLQEANNTFIESITNATTPEQVAAAHEAYEATLKGLGTPEARAEYLKQRGIPNNRNPLAYGDMVDRIAGGETLTQAEIDSAVGSGLISSAQGNELKGMNGAGLEAQGAALKPVRPQIKAIASAAANGILAEKKVPPDASKAASVAIAADIEQRMTAHLSNLLKSDPDMTQGQLVQEAQDWAAKNGASLGNGVTWDPESYSVKGYNYAGTVSTEQATARTWTNPATGKKGVVLSGLSVTQLESLQYDNNINNDIDAAKDRILTKDEMTSSLKAVINGNPDGIHPRVKAIADMLDMTPQLLISLQAKAQGLPNAAAVERATKYNPDNPNLSSVEQQALDVIGKYESDGAGGYNAVNQGGADGGNTVLGYSGHYAKLGGSDLTDLSVAEIMELQREDGRSWDSWFASGKLHAVGRYQFIGSTLANIVRAMGIDGSAKFTPELQDQMALWLLRNAGNGIGQWVGPTNYATPAERAVVNQARNNVIAANRILRNPRRTEAQTRRAVRDISTAGGLFA